LLSWVFLKWFTTLTLWPVKDFGATNLSTETKLDACDELRKPLKPLLAIACVTMR